MIVYSTKHDRNDNTDLMLLIRIKKENERKMGKNITDCFQPILFAQAGPAPPQLAHSFTALTLKDHPPHSAVLSCLCKQLFCLASSLSPFMLDWSTHLSCLAFTLNTCRTEGETSAVRPHLLSQHTARHAGLKERP